jgi:4-amino-4-deoxy-L-arabinose transferase-like glycosyltransferase
MTFSKPPSTVRPLKHRTIVFIIIAVAFVLRLAWAAAIPVIPISDGTVYDSLARMLAEQGVYGWAYDRPTARWPVGTSAIYAALYFIFGHHFLPIVALNIAMSMAIVGLTFWLCKLLFNENKAIIAAGLMAIWPSNVMYVTVLSSELPFTFFVLIGFAAWFHPGQSKMFCGIGSGLMFAAATYVRPVALLLPIVLWLSAMPNWARLRAQTSTLILALVVAAIAIAPWSIRNAQLFGHFVMMSTNGGINLWIGNNPNADGYFMGTPPTPPNVNEAEEDQLLGQEARQYILEKPGAFVLRTIKKTVILHLGETIAVHWNEQGIRQRFGESMLFPLKLLTQSYWTAVLLVAFVGLAVMIRRVGLLHTMLHPIVLTWAYFTAVYAVVFGADRYHFPSHPFIAMLAAIGILFIAQLGRRRSADVQQWKIG